MNDQWFMTRDGKTRYGPFSAAKLNEFARLGRIAPADLVWKADMQKWVRAYAIPGIFSSPPVAVAVPGMWSVPSQEENSSKRPYRTSDPIPWYAVRPGCLAALGLLFVICGGWGTVQFIGMDTSVPVNPIDFMGQKVGGGRVHNIGLMQERQNGLIVSLAISGVGVFFVLAAPLLNWTRLHRIGERHEDAAHFAGRQ
jgi:hypothetical protein